MNRKIILIIVLAVCIILLSGCFQSMKYPKYEAEKQDNGQYILTSPDDISYVTFENTTWFPEVLLKGLDYGEPIGRCELGYVYKTESEVCIFTNASGGKGGYVFFLEDTVLPELSIENISNAVLESTSKRESLIITDKKMTEELIKLYKNSNKHEVKDKDSIGMIWELYMECEQLNDLFYWIDIYTDGDDYYMQISRQYDNHANLVSIVCSKCTSEMEAILEKN